MLVTVSGMVGSGKSTAAADLLRVLEREGFRATEWRFQLLPCFTLLKSRRGLAVDNPSQPRPAVRWVGYQRKRLTVRAAAGHALMTLAFRLYRLTRDRRTVYVCNRYFYDSFVHYSLTSARERVCAYLLQRFVPTPDLAILMVASPQTIAQRRPHYSKDYLASVWAAYTNMRARFPELNEVSTDPGEAVVERLADLVRPLSRRQAHPS